MEVSLCILCFCAVVCSVSGYPTGPPADYSVCNTMMPSSLSPHRLQLGNGTYDIATNASLSNTSGYFNYKAGEKYSVTVLTTGEDLTFKGFLVQAWDPSDKRIGTFSVTDASVQRLLDCSSVNYAIPPAGTVCHSIRNTKETQVVVWTAPPSGNGLVDFRFTLVRSYTEYFGPLSAASPDGSIESDRPKLPESVTPPYRDPESYRIIARNPTHCKVSDCTVFVGIDTNEGNSEYLDVYLTGKAQAWVAVGFTDTPDMYSASVIGCNFNPELDMMEALDTWNSADRRDNSLVDPQRNYLHRGSYVNGTITCTIARKINYNFTEDEDTDELVDTNSYDKSSDFNYLDSSFYLLFGIGNDRAARSLTPHKYGFNGVPKISKSKVNPATGRASLGTDSIRPALTRTHGVLMWIAWPVLACTGIFFAMWMKSVFPGGAWFQAHRALMLASLVVACMGMVAIIASQYRSVPTKGIINFRDNDTALVHLIFGVLVMAILIVNPLISLLRCKPSSKWRWIYNVVHGYGLGNLGQLLAVINVGIGLAVFDKNISSVADYRVFWLYVVYIIVFILMNLGLVIFYVVTRYNGTSGGAESSGLLQGEDSKNDKAKPAAVASSNNFIWGVLLGYLVFVTILTVAVIVLLAI